MRWRERRRGRVRGRVGRAVQFARELFSSCRASPESGDDPDELGGGLGVREPRRPLHPRMSGGVALEAPPEERRDIWAVGEEDRG